MQEDGKTSSSAFWQSGGEAEIVASPEEEGVSGNRQLPHCFSLSCVEMHAETDQGLSRRRGCILLLLFPHHSLCVSNPLSIQDFSLSSLMPSPLWIFCLVFLSSVSLLAQTLTVISRLYRELRISSCDWTWLLMLILNNQFKGLLLHYLWRKNINWLDRTTTTTTPHFIPHSFTDLLEQGKETTYCFCLNQIFITLQTSAFKLWVLMMWNSLNSFKARIKA